MKWERFTAKSGRIGGLRMTIGMSGSFALSQEAWNAINSPSTVMLMFDADRQVIGIQACDDATAWTVNATTRQIRGRPFLHTTSGSNTARYGSLLKYATTFSV